MTVYMYVYRCHTLLWRYIIYAYVTSMWKYMRTWQTCDVRSVRAKLVTTYAHMTNVYSYVSSMWKCMSTWQTCNISYAYVSIMWKYIQLDILFTLNKDQIISWQKEPAFFSSNVTIISRWKLQGQIIHI